MWRTIYRTTIEPETFLDLADVRTLLAATAADHAPGTAGAAVTTVEEAVDAALSWTATQQRRYAGLVADAKAAGCEALVVRTVLAQSAPLASALGCWNQGASAPGVFEDEVALKVLALLACDVGVGRPRSSRYDEFQALARQYDRPELVATAEELAVVRKIRDGMFAFPAALYAVSRRSDALGPEIAGIDLLLRSVGAFPWWSALRATMDAAIDWSRLDLRTPAAPDHDAPLDIARWVAQRYAELGEANRGRVAEGARWAAAALAIWSESLFGECADVFDPARTMANLLRERAREASVYHHDFSLGGRALAEWMADARTDPGPLLKVLADSRLVRPGNAGRSPLVNGMIGPRGPMFRVFSSEDIAVIRRWIDALPAATPSTPVHAGPAVPAVPAAWGGDRGTDAGVEPTSIRDAYFVLQGRALPGRTRRFAVRYVRRWLAQASLSLDRSDRSLPREWTPAGLRPWLLDQHDRHGREFEDTDGQQRPGRDALIDQTLQLAPLTLIDGSWLQGFTETSLASSRFGYPLFETYWDELGNGRIPLNHPVIYRDVLRQMGIELAPTGSREFAHDPRLRDESFRRPVYWLCLGKLPTTFLPEILGMNLAMELSGVGGSYRTAREHLRYYGFSTRFVDIHNTIDNVSTGHSAWAADAIDTYMRQALPLSGDTEGAHLWQRVRTGYESLAPLPGMRSNLIGYRFTAPPWRTAEPVADTAALFHHTPVTGGA